MADTGGIDEQRGAEGLDPAVAMAPPATAPKPPESEEQRLQGMADAANTDMLKKYTAEWVAEPERARARANLALTVSTGFATLLGFGTLVAGISENFESETDLTLGFLMATFVAWLLAVLAALVAVSWDVPGRPGDLGSSGHASTVAELIDGIPAWADHEAKWLQRRTHRSVAWMCVAILLTFVTVLVSVIDEVPPPDPKPAEVVFVEDVEVPLEEICELEFSPVPVRVVGPIDAEADRVTLEIDSCDGSEAPRRFVVAWEFIKALVFLN